MDFSSYPLDTQVKYYQTPHHYMLNGGPYCIEIQQVCSFKISSRNHQSDSMIFNLVKLAELTMEGTDTNLEYIYKIEALSENVTNVDWWNQTYSVVGFRLKLERHYAQYLLNYYFPSLIFVVVSWISFTIPPEIVPGRMGLLVTLLLVLVNFFGTVIQTKPPTKKPTNLDVWMLACIVFVCGALFSYAALLFRQMSNGTVSQVSRVPKRPTPKPETDSNKHKVQSNRHLRWDMNCLKCFPIAFIMFNFVYWPIVSFNR